MSIFNELVNDQQEYINNYKRLRAMHISNEVKEATKRKEITYSVEAFKNGVSVYRETKTRDLEDVLTLESSTYGSSSLGAAQVIKTWNERGKIGAIKWVYDLLYIS